MRLLAAFGLALLVVLGMLLVGLKLSGFMEQGSARTLNLHEVDLLSETQRWDLVELLGEGDSTPPKFPLPTDIPPLQVDRDGQRSESETP